MKKYFQGLALILICITGFNNIGYSLSAYEVKKTNDFNVKIIFASTPGAQPTSMIFMNFASNGYAVGYSAAIGSPDGYIAIRRSGSAPTGQPTNGAIYSVNNSIGNGTVAFIGSELLFSETTLGANTLYFYSIFSYNGTGSQIKYLQTSPLLGSRTTLENQPTVQPTSLNFSAVTATSFNASFSGAPGGPDGYLILRKQGGTPTGTPSAGSPYTVGNTLGDGMVAAVGSSSTFSESSLTPGTSYSYAVFSLKGTGQATNYLTTSPLTASKFTLSSAPTASAGSSITTTSFTSGWNSVTGATNYRLDVSTDNFSTYLSGYQDLTVAGILQAVSGLAAGTTFYYRVRANNGSGVSANSNTISIITKPTEPVAKVASSISETGFTANWSSVTGTTSYLLEVSSNGFVSMIVGYSPKEVPGASDAISGLSVGTEYGYRVKAKNSSGSSEYSNMITQFTRPSIPTDLNVGQLTGSSFLASWSAAPGIEGYELDVSNDNFVTFIPGYEARRIVGAREEFVTGLLSNIIYKFRVRAYNSGGNSENSVAKAVLTVGGVYAPPVVTNGTSSSTSSVASVSGGVGVLTLSFYHRKISEKNFTAEPLQTVGIGNTSFNLPSNYFDDIGMEYYFLLKDEIETESTSPKSFIYVTKISETIPNLSFGGKRENYRIFSIPLQMSDNTIDNIFNPVIIQFGGYKKDKWRLVQYLSGKNVDYTEGLAKIEQGKGYWFNSTDPVTLSISGTAIQVNQSQPFVMHLSAGWNQIGNPFNFPISWSDVLALNGNPSTVSGLFTYNPSSVSFNQNASLLEAWEGGFVRADQAISLNIPVTVKQTAGRQGRKYGIETSELNMDSWYLPITLHQGFAINDQGGIGMHPDASEGKDEFDEHTLPRFVNYLELNSYHPNYFIPKFTRDVVSTQSSHNWDFVVESNFEGPEIDLSWNNIALGQNAAQLWLIDLTDNNIIDMKQSSSYRFPSSARHLLSIFFGVSQKEIIPQLNVLGKAYPNPFVREAFIPYMASGTEHIDVSIYDFMGKRIKTLVNELPAAGYHEASWNGDNEQGGSVAQGIYIYKLSSVTNRIQLGRLVVR